jgi:hypothetical protein
MPFHHGVLGRPSHARQREDWDHNTKDVHHLKLITVMMDSKDEINKKQREHMQIDVKA